MDFKLDAFPVDDTVGGIRSTEKIRIIICYVLNDIGASMTREALQSALYDNGVANYFEISQAIDDLITVGALTSSEPGENSVLNVTEKGGRIAKELEKELSVYIKNKAVKAAKLTLLYEKRERENDVSVTRLDNKKYRLDITMHSGISDAKGSDELLRVSVFVTDFMQAENMKRAFLNNPVMLYSKVIEGLTSDPTFKE